MAARHPQTPVIRLLVISDSGGPPFHASEAAGAGPLQKLADLRAAGAAEVTFAKDDELLEGAAAGAEAILLWKGGRAVLQRAFAAAVASGTLRSAPSAAPAFGR